MFSHRRVLTNIVLRREKGSYRTRSAIGSAIGRALSRPISCKPLRGAQPRGSGAIVSKTSAFQKRDRGCDSQPRPQPRLNSRSGGLNALRGLRTVRPCEAFKTPFSAVGPFEGALSRFIPISALGLGVHVSRRKSGACPWSIPLSYCKVGYLVHPSFSVFGGGLE